MREWCHLHPEQVYVGVCPLCLNERLLILAAKQDLNSSTNYKTKLFSSSLSLPKVFTALGSLRHCRKKPHPHHRHHHYHHHDFDDFFDCPDSTSTGYEDESFISIKFGENGEVSWDKGTSNVSKVSLEHFNMAWPSQTLFNHGVNKGNSGNKNVVDHANPRTGSLRWPKGIGHLLQVIRWRRSKKANGGGERGGRGVVMAN